MNPHCDGCTLRCWVTLIEVSGKQFVCDDQPTAVPYHLLIVVLFLKFRAVI